MNNLGVYVQIPFCASKCTFCNFSSKVAPAVELESYLASLEREIELLSSKTQTTRAGGPRRWADLLDLAVDSLYFGGGTPTLAGRERLGGLFAALGRRFRFTDAPEVTLEMTPGSAHAAMLATCRSFGVNRLSIGAQSFEDRELRSVGRLHSASESAQQVRLARAAGFENVSLDLIAGLPHQTRDSWLASLRRAIELEPEHVSIYLFEVDEKSRLGNEVLRHGERYHAPEVPDDDFMAAAYEQAQGVLAAAGYVQYEISNFARPGFESRHNRKYWRLDPYLGLGAGAHSYDGHARWSNEISVSDYAARLAQGDLPVVESHALAEAEQIEEFFFLGLRERSGVDLAGAAARWGRDALEPWRPRIDSLLERGVLEESGGQLSLAPEAYLVSNEIFQEFLG
ncbi:MAG TPA: radical SAM family heme chaperone HemW [Terriglobia bacterium]|jgi:oxygen-independent coproporphyrinogen-3 oxidase|nr:radical SAM family heme chaperone HemW [Terriglobia bacterium]